MWVPLVIIHFNRFNGIFPFQPSKFWGTPMTSWNPSFPGPPWTRGGSYLLLLRGACERSQKLQTIRAWDPTPWIEFWIADDSCVEVDETLGPMGGPFGGSGRCPDAQSHVFSFCPFRTCIRLMSNLPGLSPFPDAKNTEDGRGTRQCPLAISELVTTINMCQNLSSEYRYEI